MLAPIKNEVEYNDALSRVYELIVIKKYEQEHYRIGCGNTEK